MSFAGDQLDVRPFQLAFFRFFCATVLLTAFMAVTWFTGRHETIRRDLALIGKHWWKLAPLGILGHGIFVSLVYFSLYTGQVPTIAVLQTAMPAVVVAAGFVLFRDRLTLWQSIHGEIIERHSKLECFCWLTRPKFDMTYLPCNSPTVDSKPRKTLSWQWFT